jgi:hypothetical protein
VTTLEHITKELRIDIKPLGENIFTGKVGFRSTCVCGATWDTWIRPTLPTPIHTAAKQLLPVINVKKRTLKPSVSLDVH